MMLSVAVDGVLSTSNRKPPLRIPLRRVAEILTHPGQVEMVSPKWVDMLAHERSDVAQRFVSNLMALGTSLGDDSVHLHHVPGHHGIVQYRYATKRVDLIAEFSATQHAFFAETEKPRQVMRGFPLIQLASHAPPVCFVIECLQNVHRFVNAPDLGQPLVHAVSTGIRAKPMEDE